jgi:hypothetical protein
MGQSGPCQFLPGQICRPFGSPRCRGWQPASLCFPRETNPRPVRPGGFPRATRAARLVFFQSRGHPSREVAAVTQVLRSPPTSSIQIQTRKEHHFPRAAAPPHHQRSRGPSSRGASRESRGSRRSRTWGEARGCHVHVRQSVHLHLHPHLLPHRSFSIC